MLAIVTEIFTLALIVSGCLGLIIGTLATWLAGKPNKYRIYERITLLRDNLEKSQAQLQQQQEESNLLHQQVVRLETLLDQAKRENATRAQFLDEARDKLHYAFTALSSEALRHNNQAFLTLASSTFDKYYAEADAQLAHKEKTVENLVSPIRESLKRVNYQIEEMEKSRLRAHGGLIEQIRALASTHDKLQTETRNLVKALRVPTVRGRWGEIQLKRVVEIAGMVEHCDFFQQQSVTTDSGRLRPDLLVQLPAGKNIVVDAKAPLQAYLEAIEASDETTRLAKLKEHAQQIRSHLGKLSAKSYWEQFQPTPEFVILFLPGESFFSAALEQDPKLIEEGVQQKVILATPTTLISLLRAVYYGWRQEKIGQNAQEISNLGRKLHERMAILVEYLSKIGSALGRSLETYNAAVASLEMRVLPSARQFKDLGAGSHRDIDNLDPIIIAPRQLTIDEEETTLSGQTSFRFDEKQEERPSDTK